MAKTKADKWDRDESFMAIATVAWPEELKTATEETQRSYGKEYSNKQAARQRMRLRWEGFRNAEIVAEKVAELQRAADCLTEKMQRMIGKAA